MRISGIDANLLIALNALLTERNVSGTAPMPKWGWGEVKGPYVAG